jgi:hypothetical protein
MKEKKTVAPQQEALTEWQHDASQKITRLCRNHKPVGVDARIIKNQYFLVGTNHHIAGKQINQQNASLY